MDRVPAIGDPNDLICRIVCTSAKSLLEFPSVSDLDIKAVIPLPITYQLTCGGFESHLLAALNHSNIHCFAPAVLHSICNGFHSVSKVRAVIHQFIVSLL